MPKQTRGAVLTLRITAHEQEELRRAAGLRQQSVSEYVRSIVRGDMALLTGLTSVKASDQMTRNAAAPHQQTGSDIQVHGSSWVSHGPAQVVNGQTMITVASYK